MAPLVASTCSCAACKGKTSTQLSTFTGSRTRCILRGPSGHNQSLVGSFAGDSSAGARLLMAGPLSTSPSRSNRDPWHGQSQVCSAWFHATMPSKSLAVLDARRKLGITEQCELGTHMVGGTTTPGWSVT